MWLRWLAVLGAVTLAVAGCGGGSTPPSGVASKAPGQILAAASRAIEAANSVHVVGSVVDNGIHVRLNLHLARGRGGEGEVSENGLGFALISTGKVLYIQGSDAFWTHFGGANAAKLFHGKWLKAPDSGQFGTLGSLATTHGLVGQLLSKHGKLVRSGRTTVDGQPAVGVVDRTQGGTLFVATTGRPYPLEIVKRGTNGGYVKFTDFNQPVKVTPPSKSISLPNGA
ncbi:MAG TPA: hypothetical protein VG321_02145 [Solirubrobacteraceae bacterium]|jgi:hypothetical protein|nr:hypothetical protein [Solirubrobacteraceae bacterium]